MEDEVSRLNFGGNSRPLKMRANRPPRVLMSVVFRVNIEPHGAWQLAPVVQHTRDVANVFFRNTLDHSQRQVVILAPFVTFTKSAYLGQDLPAINPEMRNKV